MRVDSCLPDVRTWFPATYMDGPGQSPPRRTHFTRPLGTVRLDGAPKEHRHSGAQMAAMAN
jgi:hypothetical protein